jgi:hypothetical protein
MEYVSARKRHIPYTEHPDCFHKYCSPLAQESLEKPIVQKHHLVVKTKKQTQDGMAITPSNQDHLPIQPEPFSTTKDFLVGNYLVPLSSKPLTVSEPRIGLAVSMMLTGYRC